MAELKRRFFHVEIMHKGYTAHPMLDALTAKRLEENGKSLNIVKCFVPKIFSLLMWNNQRAHPEGMRSEQKSVPTISDNVGKETFSNTILLVNITCY